METKQKHIVKLSANENFYGCSEKVKTVIKENADKVSLYPDYFQNELKEKIAELNKVSAGTIMLGVGVVGVIDTIIRLLVKSDGEIITFERSFVAYGQLAKMHNKKIHFAGLTDYTCSTETIFPLLNEKTNVIFIANPNNPTGTIITHNHLENFLKKIPASVFVVIDEAYFEYAHDNNFPDTLKLQPSYSNLIVLRGYSKIYGLAGLRIGYGIASENIALMMENNRMPYSINSLASHAAIAAMSDQEFVRVCSEKNRINRDFLFQGLKSQGYNVIPSQSNYIFMLFNSDEEKLTVYNKLLQENIQVCNLSVFGQDKSLRIGVGDKETNQRILDCLT